MRGLDWAILASLASLSFTGVAVAKEPTTHVLSITLPGGSVEQVRYRGAVPPQIVLTRGPGPWAAFSPLPLFVAPFPSFAEFNRIFAEMNRQTAALLKEAETLVSLPAVPADRSSAAAFGNLPPGSAGYLFVATFSGNGDCTESLAITSQGNGASPRVVRHSSGNCAQAPRGVEEPPPPLGSPAGRGQRLLSASAAGAEPYAGLVHPIPLVGR